MTIPLATQRITVTRVEDGVDIDPYAPPSAHPAPTTIATNVRSVISTPSGGTKLVGGERVVNNTQLRCDPIDLQPGDVVDDGQGNVWTVLNVSQMNALGQKFTIASMRTTTGAT